MDELHIVDHEEWWLMWEDGYGNHGIKAKFPNEREAQRMLPQFRDARPDRTINVFAVKVCRTAEKLEW